MTMERAALALLPPAARQVISLESAGGIAMNLTKPNAFLVNIASAMIIFLIAADIARSGYQFGRLLAGL